MTENIRTCVFSRTDLGCGGVFGVAAEVQTIENPGCADPEGCVFELSRPATDGDAYTAVSREV